MIDAKMTIKQFIMNTRNIENSFGCDVQPQSVNFEFTRQG